jgi:hypothetical protein
MSRILLRLNGKELNCIFSAVTTELEVLEDNLKSPETTATESEEILESIETCKAILSKLTSDGSTYQLSD